MKAPKTKKQEKATTGIPRLDELLGECTIISIAMAHVCMKLSREKTELGDRITAALKEQLQEAKQENYTGYDKECDVLPTQKWLCFLDGFLLGSKETRPSS